MPLARPARLAFLIVALLACLGAARADVGLTLSVQTDARERGLSYSGNKPGMQLGLAWDGDGGWYAGASLSRPRFAQGSEGALRVYGGRVFALRVGLDAEAGLLQHRYDTVTNYDFTEAYAGLLGEGWNVRVYASPDYYGVGERSLYSELNLHWPLAPGVAAVGHVGVLRAHGKSRVNYTEQHGPTRLDWRAGASWQLGEGGEVQLVWHSASRGGPYTWASASRRRTATLNLTLAF